MTSKSVLRREAIQRKDGPTDNEEENSICEQIEVNGETWVKLSDVQEMMASLTSPAFREVKKKGDTWKLLT